MGRESTTSQPTLQKRQAPKWCKNCTSPDLYAGRYCSACYQYKRKHGKERPRHLWDKDFCCNTCGVPLSSQGKRQGQQRKRQCRGYCISCWNYRTKYKIDRPRRLWGIGKYGWCACGYPANYQKDGFNLCSRCAEEFHDRND